MDPSKIFKTIWSLKHWISPIADIWQVTEIVANSSILNLPPFWTCISHWTEKSFLQIGLLGLGKIHTGRLRKRTRTVQQIIPWEALLTCIIQHRAKQGSVPERDGVRWNRRLTPRDLEIVKTRDGWNMITRGMDCMARYIKIAFFVWRSFMIITWKERLHRNGW